MVEERKLKKKKKNYFIFNLDFSLREIVIAAIPNENINNSIGKLEINNPPLL